jgi:hypothetical protein
MYRDRRHVKTIPRKTYLSEAQDAAFLAAADKLGVEPSVLLRECVVRVTAYINSQRSERIERPKRATDFISINPPGHVPLNGNYRLCRAA